MKKIDIRRFKNPSSLKKVLKKPGGDLMDPGDGSSGSWITEGEIPGSESGYTGHGGGYAPETGGQLSGGSGGGGGGGSSSTTDEYGNNPYSGSGSCPDGMSWQYQGYGLYQCVETGTGGGGQDEEDLGSEVDPDDPGGDSCVWQCADGCSQTGDCYGQPSGVYYTSSNCCDGGTPGGEGEGCSPSYNLLGQCISCCDGGDDGTGDDDSPSGTCYNITGQAIDCCQSNCIAGPCGEGCGDPGGGDDGEGDCLQYNLMGQCIEWDVGGDLDPGEDEGVCMYNCADGCTQQMPCNGQPSGVYYTSENCCEGGNPGGDDQGCEPSYNLLGQCISCCG